MGRVTRHPLLPHSARWILHEGCMHILTDQNLWINFAEMEESVGNIGSYDQAYSSAWLYKTTCEKHSNSILREWGVIHTKERSK